MTAAIAALAAGLFFASCGNGSQETDSSSAPSASTTQPAETAAQADDPMKNKGIGPVTSVSLGELDADLAAEGKELYESLCTACHKLDQRYIGPPLQEVTSRRSPEWIMNMIMNPNEMVQQDPIAKKLLAEYISPMANQNISEEQARKILEYFRSVNPN